MIFRSYGENDLQVRLNMKKRTILNFKAASLIWFILWNEKGLNNGFERNFGSYAHYSWLYLIII